jgi:hypothetical protein|tara:strand:+ start:893 stop:1030 length:138 start_codon:yes stop_codon:yes gene_type:complete
MRTNFLQRQSQASVKHNEQAAATDADGRYFVQIASNPSRKAQQKE